MYRDRVKDTSSSTGTGAITLANSAPFGYQTFAAAFGSTPILVAYCIADQAGASWEVGTGTFNGTTGLTRTTVLASSNAGALVPFSVGTKDVFCTAPSSYLVPFSGSTQGVVPASAGGTSNFLRADGQFAVPPGTVTSPGGATTQIQYNNAGAFAGNANFTYNAGTNTVTFGNLTGSALAMTIQPRAPTVLENAGTLTIRARDANVSRANANGGGVTIQGGDNTGTGFSGTVRLLSQDNTTYVSVSNENGVAALDAYGAGFTIAGGALIAQGSTIPPPVDAPTQFIAGINSASSGNNGFQFLTDNGTIFEFGESTFGTQEIAFFGVTPVAQSTGWGSPTGTATKTTFATSTVTTAQLAERVKAIIDYLKLRGDFGS
jgi:hypothetical protein